jgi:hypothetical protein
MNSDTVVSVAVKGALSALELKPGCRYIIFADRKAVPQGVLEKLASALWSQYKIRTMVIVTAGPPKDAVQVLEVEP